ncbi:DUF3836 domain-containing protein [Parabacteroides sp. PF5-9]|uniref:DUF3836 domain-containing protein n=1 Tax=Parabacteroides sp. PF5-9 TaxID=1742404 RepID=UPI0024766C18|nr:DUF3836 domain-containing protein [Parabacteroides sp. PF5-9]MDH6356332.1 hypothetical protein [Parabacteroides sp. PF5-9]
MKTIRLTRIMYVLIAFFMISSMVNALSPKEYKFNTTEKDGKIMSKTVYSFENGFLHYEWLYEFDYDENGRVASKKAYRWHDGSSAWEPYSQMSYRYDKQVEIDADYAMWDKKKKQYAFVQKMTLPFTNYDSIF